VRYLLNLAITFTLILSTLGGAPVASAKAVTFQTGAVARLMADMTPAEKVGQLFLVSFYGTSVEEGTDIEALIRQSHIGGVVLLAANDNLTDTVNTPLQVLTLANQLQSVAAAGAQTPREELGLGPPPFIPLFIATQHLGDGYPSTEIRTGLTELPNEMAIGATWNPEQAEAVGRITGEELSALGINLLLGPSLDVLETPRPQGLWDLGANTFGGDGFWAGRMAQAYIRGVHAGSEGKLAVISRHFPGHGSSDRNPAVEIPTVRKSLEQLKQIELAPFFAVTGNAPDPESTTDGLLTAHIRFQGFQGNIYQTTSPVSFDSQALGDLLALDELKDWRANGGVTVSDSLGVRAVKRFYDPNLRTFNNRRIAREAFTAGNDLLFLSEFGLNPRADQAENIADTIAYFTQQYEADRTFRNRVDEAVERILTLKLRLYGGEFDPTTVQQPESALSALGQGEDRVRGLAQAAATLVGLTIEELAARVPEGPLSGDRIVFFTDTRVGRQCQTCPAVPLLGERALENSVLTLFGPGGSAQIRTGDVQSFSFEDLALYLSAAPGPSSGDSTPTPEPSSVENALNQSDWIVFAMLNVTPEVPASGVVSTFLTQRPDLVRTKKIIAFGFNAPYYLDSTDLSKLTAFYALYSKAPVFVDVAARLLFQQLAPRGALPVSVPSVDYNLSRVTAPDPQQAIEIFSDRTTGLKVGDTIQLQTSVIRDLNGHAVPDGTAVRFLVLYQQEGLSDSFDTVTEAGVAGMSLPLDRIGQLEIMASSEPALVSRGLQINVLDNATIIIITVTPLPTEVSTRTPIPIPSATPAAPTATLAPTPVATGPLTPVGRVAGRDFYLLILGLAAVLFAGYRLGSSETQPTRRLRVALSGAIGTLAGYNFYALGLPGANLALPLGAWAASAFVVLGAAAGLIAGWYWFVRREQSLLRRARAGGEETE
jgi:beta-N-acetylhexosaminidase